MVAFSILKQSLSLYLRMCMRKRLEAGGGKAKVSKEEAWFLGEVREVMGWCDRVLLPVLTKEGER